MSYLAMSNRPVLLRTLLREIAKTLNARHVLMACSASS